MRKKLSDYWIQKIILHFCVDIEASKAAKLIGLNRNTINNYYNFFRHLISNYQDGLIESSVDNKLINKQLITQHFSLLNIGKVNQKKFYAYEVYGLFEVDGFIFSEVVDPKLIKNIFYSPGSSVSSESHIHEGFYHKYDALLFGMFPKLVFLNYQHNAISQQSTSIFNIESFWSFCCRRLQKFNGISRHFYYHLKECEWRWKKEDDQLVQHLHKLIKKSA